MIKTTILSMAPWTVLALTAVLGVTMHPDASASQLLATVAGVCGGAIVQRRSSDPQTTTVTAGDPPTVETRS